MLILSQTDTMVAHAPTDIHADTHASTEAAGHGEASGGLPQFDTSVWVGQIVYLLVLFFVLYLLIAKVFAPRSPTSSCTLPAKMSSLGCSVSASSCAA